jgi:hypothetical protein
MRPYDALACATIKPAHFMEETDIWGTVAVGKRADLLLLRTSPLADIGALREIEAVFVNGYELDRTTLDQLLRKRADLVDSAPRLPYADLPAHGGDSVVAAEGLWTERIYGTLYGKGGWRHSRLADGGWLVEERHAGATPRRHVERRSTRLELAPDLRIRVGDYRTESFVGEELSQIEWSSKTGYTVRYRDVDGWTTVASLPTEMLVPSERLTLSIQPLIFARLGDKLGDAVRALSIEKGEPSVTEAKISRAPAEPSDAPDESRWRLEVMRPTEATVQTYRATSDGLFVGLSEIMPLLWVREISSLVAQSR